MDSKEVVKKEEAALPVVTMADMFADAGMGFEGMSAKDVAIPFVAILQGLSPQVKRGPAQIEGAREGDIFNTVSQQIIKGEDGITVVPCAYQKKWVEWKTRESGGGFVQQHDTEDILNETSKNERGQDVLKNGNLVVTTAYHYVIVVTAEGFYKAVISMTSTNLKKSRRWNAQMGSIQVTQGERRFNPPSFSHSYVLRTVMETKDGNSWFTWDIKTPDLIAFKAPDLYRAAKKFSTDVNGGLVKAPEPTQREDETAPVSGESNHF